MSRPRIITNKVDSSGLIGQNHIQKSEVIYSGDKVRESKDQLHKAI